MQFSISRNVKLPVVVPRSQLPAQSDLNQMRSRTARSCLLSEDANPHVFVRPMAQQIAIVVSSSTNLQVTGSDEISLANQDGLLTLASAVCAESDTAVVARILTSDRATVLEVFRQGKGLVRTQMDRTKNIQHISVIEKEGKVVVALATVSKASFEHQRTKSELLFFQVNEATCKKLAQFDLRAAAGVSVRTLLRTPDALYVNMDDAQLYRIELAQMLALLESQAGNVSMADLDMREFNLQQTSAGELVAVHEMTDTDDTWGGNLLAAVFANGSIAVFDLDKQDLLRVVQQDQDYAVLDSASAFHDASTGSDLFVLVQATSFLNLFKLQPASRGFELVATLASTLDPSVVSAKIVSPQTVVLIQQSGSSLFEVLIVVQSGKRLALESSAQAVEANSLLSQPLIEELLSQDLCIKLAELVLSKVQQQFQFKAVGSLRNALEDALRMQKDQSLARILQEMKAHFAQGLTGIQVVNAHRDKVLQTLNAEITKVEGLRTVFNAILQRQGEQARQNQQTMGITSLRSAEQKEIISIKTFIEVQLQKRSDLLLLLKYLIKTDLVFHLRNNDLKQKTRLRFSNQKNSKFIDELLREAPDSLQKKNLPLDTIEDFLELFDSCQKHAVAVVFYHARLVKSFCGLDVGFQHDLDRLINAQEQAQVEGFEYLDSQLEEASAGLTANVVRTLQQNSLVRSSFILRQLVQAGRFELALLALGTSERDELSENDLQQYLTDIVTTLTRTEKLELGFDILMNLEKPLKLDAHENVYAKAIEQLVDTLVRDCAFQKFLSRAFGTSLFDRIATACIQTKYPNLEIAQLLWQRREVQAIGVGKRLQFQQSSGEIASSFHQNLVRSQVVDAFDKDLFSLEQKAATQKVSSLSSSEIELMEVDGGQKRAEEQIDPHRIQQLIEPFHAHTKAASEVELCDFFMASADPFSQTPDQFFDLLTGDVVIPSYKHDQQGAFDRRIFTKYEIEQLDDADMFAHAPQPSQIAYPSLFPSLASHQGNQGREVASSFEQQPAFAPAKTQIFQAAASVQSQLLSRSETSYVASQRRDSPMSMGSMMQRSMQQQARDILTPAQRYPQDNLIHADDVSVQMFSAVPSNNARDPSASDVQDWTEEAESDLNAGQKDVRRQTGPVSAP